LIAGLMMVLMASALAQKGDDPILTLKMCWQYASVISDSQPVADANYVYIAEPGGRISAISVLTGNRVWSTELGGEVSSDIATDGANVYVVTNDASGGAHLRSLGIASGIPDWKFDYRPGTNVQIVEVGGSIVTSQRSGEVSAYRPGAARPDWTLTLPAKIARSFGGSSILIATNDRKIHSIDVASGKEKYVYSVDGDIETAITVGDDVLTGDGRGRVTKFVEGSRSWRFRNGAKITALSETRRGIVVASADNFVYLVSDYNGDVIWKKRLPARVSGVMVTGDVAVVTSVGESEAALIDLETGKFAGRFTLKDGELFIKAPIYAGGRFIFFTTSRVFAASQTPCTGN
jgi:outer membrane protein assembly factor BamB